MIVVWKDAAIDTNFDGHPDDVGTATVLNHTIGFLLRKTKDTIIVVQDITPDENTVRGPYGIPRVLVKDIIYLQPKQGE